MTDKYVPEEGEHLEVVLRTDRYIPEEGEHLEVVLRGTASFLIPSHENGFYLKRDDKYQWVNVESPTLVSIAKLPDLPNPEPEWQLRDMIQIEGLDGLWTYTYPDWRPSLESYQPLSPGRISAAWRVGRVRRVRVVPA